jgi:DNA polymerase I-like protein with 3'-5' exonuclease and polymerase domains
LNGTPSNNTLDVDLDCPEALRAAPLVLPATGWIFGRGSASRSHWIYRADRPFDTAQDKFTDLDGAVLVELRGTGGLTIYPPSTHKETGERITWELFTDPGDVTLAELQRAVRELASCSLLARHWPTKGTRQDAFLALVGGLLRAGWQQERTEHFVEALAQATRDDERRKRIQVVALTAGKLEQDRMTTGWPKLEEVIGQDGKAVVRRARQWLGMLRTASSTPSPKKVRVLQPYRPFPVEALPAPLAEYVRQGARALGCDPVYLALPVLATVASAIGNTRVIRLKRTWIEPSVVWALIIGDSGTLKSPAYLLAVAYLFRVQKHLLKEFKAAVAQYGEKLAEYRTAKKAASECATSLGDPPEQPVYRRVIVSDITIQKLAEILEDNPRGVLVARDELAAWLGSFKQYKGKSEGSDLPHWLEMHRAGTVIVDRKTGDRTHYFVERAAVSITGGIQPGVLVRALTEEFLEAGGGARILMAMPPKLPKKWSELEIAPDVEHAYQDILDKLLALDFDLKDGEKAPHILSLSPDGKTAWVTFYNSWAKKQAAVEGELATAFSKLEGYAARLALLHHVVTHVARGTSDTHPVGLVSIEAGITLSRWFAGESRRIYSTLAESSEERDARRLIEWIQTRGGRTTVKELQRSNQRKYPSSEQAEAALQALVDGDAGRWEERPPSPKGGRPTRDFVLCVTYDETDETSPGDDDGEDISPTTLHDETLPPSNETPEKPGDFQVSSVSSYVTHDTRLSVNGVRREAEVSSCAGEVSSCTMPCRLVGDRAGLDMVAAALEETALVGLDVETTGLDPRADRVRLLSLCTDTIDGGRFTYLVDCFAIDPSPLWDALAAKELVLHHAAFDLAFLARMGFTPVGKVRDTMLLAQLLTAGTSERATLAACCERWLARPIDKALQKSQWSGELTDAQLAYAALDVEVLAPLFKTLAAKIKEAGLVEAAKIEQRCLPAIVWIGQQGVALDKNAWKTLADAACREADHLRQELDRQAPARPGTFDGMAGWNWDSTHQAREALALAGCEVENTADETLAAVDHPLAQLLRRYRLARKRGSTYGIDWLAHVREDGRVYPSWRQIGAASGRMSCSDPNMQQLPRGDYRRCIVAPPGRVLVKADYSQIELRIAAKISGDKALLDAYQRGDDLHSITARNVLGIADVTKQHRQLAKALNFGLLYGMGARGFRQYAKSQYGLDLTEDEARRYRDAFFKSYPGLATWHRRVRSRKATETRTLAGRRRLLNDKTPDTHRLNTPVQGTGADGLKLALVLLWERREQAPCAFPVLAVHDEIVVEANADQANAVGSWLKDAMVEAMAPLIAPVPVEVEVKIARTWGGA